MKLSLLPQRGRRCLMLIVVSVWLAACGWTVPPTPVVPEPPTPTLPPTPSPLPRGGVLNLRIGADITDIRPWQPRSRGEEYLIGLLYSGLMRLDADLWPTPDLAERLDIDASGRVLTFTLRPNLRWHDGQPLTAADVLFTLEALRNLPETSTALLADLRYIATASAIDERTVVIELRSRYAPMLSLLAVPILPRHLFADRDVSKINFLDQPIGSGPFRLIERQAGVSLTLERFEQYHHGAPLLDRVVLSVIPETVLAQRALRDGQLLVAELPWGAQEALADVASLRSGSIPENGVYFLAFNLRPGRPFADVRLRQALATAIDLPRLVETATKGGGIPVGNGALPGSWADMTPPVTSGDLPAARALLDAAGWTLPPGATIRQREGVPLIARLYVRNDDERRVVAARRIAEIAASIGIQIEVEPVDFATVILARYVAPYDFDLLLGSWLNGAGDPTFGDTMFYDPDDFALFHSSQLEQGPADTRVTRNFVGFNDPIYDEQALIARQLYGREERRSAIAQVQSRIATELPYLYLWVDRTAVVLATRLYTLDGPIDLSTPRFLWNIERWYLQP
ncbi:peptide ABC transporter substrate-binding protein [Chloroflexus sp.]|uniref:peptide ABC transporter substrate-binding protein n=1 Tax=Chloroflexus sp. TaxID=1904827 RepID=UPI003C787741